jgi:hypothetical protein
LTWVRSALAFVSLLVTAPNWCGNQTVRADDDSMFGSEAPAPGSGRSGPECRASIGVFCFQDTTYRQHSDVSHSEFSMEAWASILWFGGAGDSLVLSADASAVQTSIGDDKDALHNNVPTYHGRVPRDGSITIWTTMNEERGDSVPYVLRVQVYRARVAPASSPLEPTGQTARLIIPMPRPVRAVDFSVIPISQLRPGLDRTAWETPVGSHKVVLTRDSLYEVCLLPCASPRTVKLKPNRTVVWTY